MHYPSGVLSFRCIILQVYYPSGVLSFRCIILQVYYPSGALSLWIRCCFWRLKIPKFRSYKFFFLIRLRPM
jgi:hypothetical protein